MAAKKKHNVQIRYKQKNGGLLPEIDFALNIDGKPLDKQIRKATFSIDGHTKLTTLTLELEPGEVEIDAEAIVEVVQ